jgi:hypothetical protein
MQRSTTPTTAMAIGFERSPAGQALVQDGTERVDVDTWIEIFFSANLLGRHVREGSDE